MPSDRGVSLWAGHLYRRAAFGAGWEQLQQALADGPQRTVDKLLRPQADVEAFNRRCEESENRGRRVDRRSAGLVAAADDGDAAPAAGEDDAVLARPFRREWQRVEPRPPDAGARSAPAQPRLGLFRLFVCRPSRAIRRCSCGSGRTRIAKPRPNDNFVRPLLETFTVGPGHFTRPGRSRGGPGLHGPVRAPGPASLAARRSTTKPPSASWAGRATSPPMTWCESCSNSRPPRSTVVRRALSLAHQRDRRARRGSDRPAGRVLRQGLQRGANSWRRCCAPTCSSRGGRIARRSKARSSLPSASRKPWKAWSPPRSSRRMSPAWARTCAGRPRSKAGRAGGIGSAPPRS